MERDAGGDVLQLHGVVLVCVGCMASSSSPERLPKSSALCGVYVEILISSQTA